MLSYDQQEIISKVNNIFENVESQFDKTGDVNQELIDSALKTIVNCPFDLNDLYLSRMEKLRSHINSKGSQGPSRD